MKIKSTLIVLVLSIGVLAGLTQRPSAEPSGGTAEAAPSAIGNQIAPDTQVRHPVWVIESDSNRTYLLGSIHVLRDQDYPLPDVFQKAYDDAEHLVMELDFTDLDPLATFATTRRLAMLPESESLESVLGVKNYAKALAAANNINIDLDQFARVDPWYAAMTITQLQLSRLGYRAENGVELFFASQAKRDAKEGSGLETIEEQLGILDGLPEDAQIRFLLESLVDEEELKTEGERMIAAWKSGDSNRLHELFAEDLQNNPELHEALLVERNEAWLPKIVAMTRQSDDYLVIVGALHLVGKQGVVSMLREQGFTVRQL